MHLRKNGLVLCGSLAFILGLCSARAEDPVEGKWKFPGGIRVLLPGGNCTNEAGQQNASWHPEGEGPARKYVITLAGGKLVHTLQLKEGGRVLQGTNNFAKPITALRVGGAPAATPFPTSATQPRATPVPVARATPVLTPEQKRAQLAELRKPVFMPGLPTIPALAVAGRTYHKVRAERVEEGRLSFWHKGGTLETVPLAEVSLQTLQTLGQNNPLLSTMTEYRNALTTFREKLTLKDGTVYTGVKLTARHEKEVTMLTDTGKVTLSTDRLTPEEMRSLLSTESGAVLAAWKAEQKKTEDAKYAQPGSPLFGGYREDISGVATGGLPVEYVRFMRRFGDPWTRDPARVVQLREHAELRDWLPGFGNFEPGNNEMFNKMVADLRKEIVSIYEQDKLRQAEMAQMKADFSDLSARVADGQFREYGIQFDPMGRGRRVETSDGSSVLWGAMAMDLATIGLYAYSDATQGTTDERAYYTRNGHVGFLIEKLGEIYPGSPEKRGLVAVRLKQSGIEIASTSGQTLTNLTVGLEFAHFTTAPHTLAFRAIYVSRLEPGATAYLNPTQTRNLWYKDWAKEEKRPDVARMWRGPEERWLWQSGGMLSAKVFAWALEAHEETSVSFPENAVAAGRYELKNATRALGEAAKGDREWALACARRVLSTVPAGSPVAAEAQALLARPDEATERGRAMIAETLRTGLVGKYAGTYQLDPEAEGRTAEKYRPALAQVRALNKKGDFVLEITGVREDRQIEAVLYAPGHPEMKRAFSGAAPAMEKGKNFFVLKPADLDKPPSPGEQSFCLSANELRMDLLGRKLEGKGTAGEGWTTYLFLLEATAGK